jgi:hypothetical protein
VRWPTFLEEPSFSAAHFGYATRPAKGNPIREHERTEALKDDNRITRCASDGMARKLGSGVKKLRYAAGLFASLWPNRRIKSIFQASKICRRQSMNRATSCPSCRRRRCLQKQSASRTRDARSPISLCSEKPIETTRHQTWRFANRFAPEE